MRATSKRLRTQTISCCTATGWLNVMPFAMQMVYLVVMKTSLPNITYLTTLTAIVLFGPRYA